MTEEKDENKPEKPEEPAKKEAESHPLPGEPHPTKDDKHPARSEPQPAHSHHAVPAVKQASKASKVAMHSSQEIVPSTSRLQMRQQSYGFSGVTGLKKVVFSAIGIEFKRPTLMYSPTYQMDPIIRFKCSDVEKIINRVLDSVFDNHIYHVETSPLLAVSIANTVMRETKALHFDRYRILSVAVIGQKRQQCYNNAVSFLWDKLRDAYVDMERENFSAFIQITVFGIYLD